MNNYISLILIILGLLSYIITFIIGYLMGKIEFLGGVYNNNDFKKTTNINNNIANKNQKISIDSTKIVTSIKTDSLEKKYENLGEVKQSTENISESVNKLKNMKG